MKVYVVVECGSCIGNSVFCNVLNVHTDFKKAQKEMWDCYADFNKNIDSLDIITSNKDIEECTIIYKSGEQFMKHFCFIEERDIND